MFYRQASNQYINEGTQFEIDGITYPSVWLNQSTPEQKAELGLVDVIATNSPFNPIYYWTGETLEGASLTYTGTPKDLADVQKQAVAQLNASAYSLLLPSDYMSSKALETGTSMPAQWANWREIIRNEALTAISAIQSAQDIQGVENVFPIAWTADPTTNKDISDIPTTVSMRQARLALNQEGLLVKVQSAIDAMTDPAKTTTQLSWDYATIVKRDDDLVIQLSSALGLDDTALDALFTLANTL